MSSPLPSTRLIALSILTSASFLSAQAQSLPARTQQPATQFSPNDTLSVSRPGGDVVAQTFVLTPEQQAEAQFTMDHQTCYYLRTYRFTPQSPGSSVLKPDGETVCQPSTKGHVEGAASQPAGLVPLSLHEVPR